MATSTLELIAIAQDLVAQLAHLSAAERLLVACAVELTVFSEFDEDQCPVLAELASKEILGALRSAAEEGMWP